VEGIKVIEQPGKMGRGGSEGVAYVNFDEIKDYNIRKVALCALGQP
jgi:hypothetical protein